MDPLSAARPCTPIRLCLIVENRLMREALARLFQKQMGFSVVAQTTSREASPRQRVNADCDILVVDSLENVSRLQFTERYVRSGPRMILFGMTEDQTCFVNAVREGVSGYLLKDASSAEIVSAVRSVARGEAVCPSRLCLVLFEQVAESFRHRSGMADQEAGQRLGLTFRQRQLICMIAKGMSNKQIAANLNLSECTVKNHVYRIMKHIDAGSRHDAVDVVRSRGYLPMG
jgi:DNA-binding NarL/FixJ family response regulator